MNDLKVTVIGVLIGGAALVGTCLLFGSMTTVDAGHTGVLVRLGSIQPGFLSEGFHTKRPFTDSVVEIDTKVRKHQIDATGGSKDLQQITTIIAVNYRFAQSRVTSVTSPSRPETRGCWDSTTCRP